MIIQLSPFLYQTGGLPFAFLRWIMEKKRISNEMAYVLGNILVAIGVALMERSDFGVSMVVAPAYVIYRKLSLVFPFFTFGMAEYSFQALLLIAMCLVLRRFRVSYLFSFVTAVFYGIILDIVMLPAALLPNQGFVVRTILYALGATIGPMGITLMFHTYISPEVYELFVKELAKKLRMPIHRFKLYYDITSALLAVALSFAFFGFGHFVGIKLGTVLCALFNGPLIGAINAFYDRHFAFYDAKNWRRYFEN